MSEPRIRRCADRKEFERVVDDYAVQGYKIKSRSENTAMIEKADFGSGTVHLVLLLFTWGIGNIIYALVKNSGREKVLIKVDE